MIQWANISIFSHGQHMEPEVLLERQRNRFAPRIFKILWTPNMYNIQTSLWLLNLFYLFFCADAKTKNKTCYNFCLDMFVYWNRQVTYRTCLQGSKYRLYRTLLRPIRPSTQASYKIGSGTTMQENQLAAQFCHAIPGSIFPLMALILCHESILWCWVGNRSTRARNSILGMAR